MVQDQADDLSDVFEESLRHLVLSGNPAGWTVGPVRDLPLSALVAGTLGWAASIVALDTARPEPDSQPVGEVLLLMLPRATSARRRPKELPVNGAEWSEFAVVEYHDGPPRFLLLARAARPIVAEPLRTWTHELYSHLLEEVG